MSKLSKYAHKLARNIKIQSGFPGVLELIGLNKLMKVKKVNVDVRPATVISAVVVHLHLPGTSASARLSQFSPILKTSPQVRPRSLRLQARRGAFFGGLITEGNFRINSFNPDQVPRIKYLPKHGKIISHPNLN